MNAPHTISPEQLCIGLYVQLDLSWMEHPFAFSSFKIRSQQQIDTLRELGLAQIRWVPERSDCAPLPPAAIEAPSQPPPAGAPPPPSEQMSSALAAKRERVEQLARLRQEIDEVERSFLRAAESLKQIIRSVHARPEQAIEAADTLVSSLVVTAMSKGDVKLHAMSQQLGEEAYFHSLNVAVLAMVLGRAVHLRDDELHQLGLGALLHDIGQIELPAALLVRKEALNKAERALYETHCRLGVKLGRKLGVSEPALAIIGQHHEAVDGSGYPDRLRGNEITLFARIVALVNAYDNLCNPSNIASALTPYEALSQMFALQRTRFDESLLQVFIRCLGVYPPGSLVQLSNDMLGLVLSVNPKNPLKPSVMVYDPEVPKEAALIIDLEAEPELKISRSMRAALLPREVHRYLDPRQRVSYYVDERAVPRKP